ncbi:MAG: tRNA uridine-5-carboxymethylaminomethyl(34) synthesis GTPase MnmE [Bacteroidetes bacterium]|nr:tRNA uridine-5-carboxymethylaminomethyl(34) synthesis GTPase MnmE [Bacteroidota bacterium]
MKTGYYDTDELITALATPWGESALAVIRTSGQGCIETIATCFSRSGKLAEAESGTLIHDFFIDPETREPLDEVVAAVYCAPSGYTGQDSVEIFCHGSLPGIQRILETLHQAGFRDARPGEFTMRAFMNGKFDLTSAEAVQEIVSAKSKKAQALALGRLSGNLFHEIDTIKHALVTILSMIEVQLDYAEDDIEESIEIPIDQIRDLERKIRQLAATFSIGRLYSEGARIVLAGRTNSGKSSLFNLFLKEDRSIVSDIHGTTRDYIESWVTIQGIPVKLFDTAGYRESKDSIEEEGIRRSAKVAEAADLILYLIDGSLGVTEENKNDLKQLSGEAEIILVWNKSDIAADEPPADSIPVSAVNGAGFGLLEQKICTKLLGPGVSVSQDSEIMIDSLRQKELLDRAAESLSEAVKTLEDKIPLDVTAPEISDAVDALGELTGEITSADILDRVFSGFCVGK